MIPLRDTLRPRRFPIVNWFIILANAAAFYYELRIGPSGQNGFITTWGLVPARFWADPQSELGNDFQRYVLAWWLVPHRKQYVGACSSLAIMWKTVWAVGAIWSFTC